ncbi:helix-turn-helix domain-containing protein [Terrilactibacillus sp. S3-3]|nr:helix-turn-helix domain-containing protein [Terrilactibacillus sp. S3-3]
MTRDQLTELWQKRMNDFEKSGLTGLQWCGAHNIKISQFRYWRRKLHLTHPIQSSGRWTSLLIEDERKDGPLLIHFGQARIEVHSGFNPDLLADVVRVLCSL